METIVIQYQDSSGEITNREISKFVPEGLDAIFTFCHERNAGRTFKLSNMLFASYSETGEAIDNVWKEFGLDMSHDGRERIESRVAYSLSAIKALKFFTLTVRSFAKLERSYLVKFLKQNFEMEGYSEKEIEMWLQNLWCGDTYAYRDGSTEEYDHLLAAIPSVVKHKCKKVALQVALGSKRRNIDQEIIDRVNREFGE